MAAIQLLSSITTGNTSVSGITIAIGTNSATRLIILSLTVSGQSGINVTPQLEDSQSGVYTFTKVGATVATSEGNVEMWYLNTNTQSKSGFITYSNKGGLTHVANVYTFQSSAGIAFQQYNGTFSVSGQTSSINTTLGTNTGSLVINQWHSGFSSLSGVSRNGTLLHQLDRGNLINGSAYTVSTSATSQNLYWSTPFSDDYAMVQTGFISSAVPNPVGSILSWNDNVFSGVNRINGISTLVVDKINTKDA